MRKLLVAVHIDEEVAARRVEPAQHVDHLGRPGHGRGLVVTGGAPLAVEVGAARVGAQVTPYAAVRVHVRHHVEGALPPQDGRDRVARVQEAAQEALHPPLRLRLPRVLPRDEPARARAAADAEQVQVAAVQRLAQDLERAQRRPGEVARELRARDQRLVLLVREGRKIRDPECGGRAGGHRDAQDAGVVGRRGAGPGLAVSGHDGPSAAPSAGVRALPGVDDVEHALCLRHVRGPEVEPLQVLLLVRALRERIRRDPQAHLDPGGAVRLLDGLDVPVACVEFAGDEHGHRATGSGPVATRA